jgi:hypothetical protein
MTRRTLLCALTRGAQTCLRLLQCLLNRLPGKP